MMIRKKTGGIHMTHSVHSLASRVLVGGVGAALPATSTDESWRHDKSKEKNKGKKRKYRP